LLAFAVIYENYRGKPFTHNPYSKLNYDGKPMSEGGKFVTLILRRSSWRVPRPYIPHFPQPVAKTRVSTGLRQVAKILNKDPATRAARRSP
jgi:hypothetical protein